MSEDFREVERLVKIMKPSVSRVLRYTVREETRPDGRCAVEKTVVSGCAVVERAEVYQVWNCVRGEGERVERESVYLEYCGSEGATAGLEGEWVGGVGGLQINFSAGAEEAGAVVELGVDSKTAPVLGRSGLDIWSRENDEKRDVCGRRCGARRTRSMAGLWSWDRGGGVPPRPFRYVSALRVFPRKHVFPPTFSLSPPTPRHHITMTSSPPPPPARDTDEPYEDPEFEPWRRITPYPPPRRPIKFIPAGFTESTFPSPAPPRKNISGAEAADLYLSIVGLSTPSLAPAASPPICETCNQPILSPAHATSLSHLASLPHSHPPHHLPRSSIGLKLMEEGGWDPDARVGLGRDGAGRRYPVKAVEKKGRAGVGAEGKGGGVVKRKVEMVGAKEVRRMEEEGRRWRQRVGRELGGTVEWGVLYGEKEGEGLKR